MISNLTFMPDPISGTRQDQNTYYRVRGRVQIFCTVNGKTADIDLKPEQELAIGVWSSPLPAPQFSHLLIVPFACFFWKCRLIRCKHQCLGRQPGYTIIFLRESPIDMNQSVHRHNLIHITIFEFLHALQTASSLRFPIKRCNGFCYIGFLPPLFPNLYNFNPALHPEDFRNKS